MFITQACSLVSVIDAWGKIESGILEGNSRWLGNFDECLNITAGPDESLADGFKTRYCSTSIPSPVSRTLFPKVSSLESIANFSDGSLPGVDSRELAAK